MFRQDCTHELARDDLLALDLHRISTVETEFFQDPKLLDRVPRHPPVVDLECALFYPFVFEGDWKCGNF